MMALEKSPLRKKLLWIILSTSGVALLVAALAFVANDVINLRAIILRNLSIQAAMIGANTTAALTFNDEKSASEILKALEADTAIECAVLYAKKEKPLSSYRCEPASISFKLAGWNGKPYRFGTNSLELLEPILLEGAQIGVLYLRSNLQVLYDRFRWYVMVAFGVWAGSLIVAFLISNRMQREVSDPILKLAQTARSISETKDYSVQLSEGREEDELKTLIVSFNDMVNQIRIQEEQLVQHRDHLEEEVTKRTAELKKTNATLTEEIQERKLAEEKIFQLNVTLEGRVKKRTAELEAKNAELERFTYTASHDLKSPLVTIQGFVDLMKQDALGGNPVRLGQDIERIRIAAAKMRQLLDELLELSRIGRIVNPSEEVTMSEVVHEAVEHVAGSIAAREVQVDIAAALPVVFGDRARLVEVVQNLVDNGVKYMEGQAKPRIEIGARQDGEEAVMYVRDNGMGIEPQYHKKVFGLFERLETKEEGTGIGLAIVKRIIEVQGGRIWVESEGKGQGSTFCWTLS